MGIFYSIFFVIFLAYLIGVLSPVKNFFSNKLEPLFTFGNSIYSSLDIMPDWFKSKQSLIEKIANLEKEVEDLNLRESDYVALSYENNRFRMESAMSLNDDFLRTSVISRFPQTPFDTILIDKGANDSVNVGDLVLASERSFVGVVGEVYPDYSIVFLNSSKNYKTEGILGRTGEILEVRGSGSNNIISEVPLDFDIMEGDSIVVSYSSNFTLAVVGSVEEDVSLGIKKVIMSLPVNVSKVETVYILKK
jgi:cell shape-determining protein MreC